MVPKDLKIVGNAEYFVLGCSKGFCCFFPSQINKLMIVFFLTSGPQCVREWAAVGIKGRMKPWHLCYGLLSSPFTLLTQLTTHVILFRRVCVCVCPFTEVLKGECRLVLSFSGQVCLLYWQPYMLVCFFYRNNKLIWSIFICCLYFSSAIPKPAVAPSEIWNNCITQDTVIQS